MLPENEVNVINDSLEHEYFIKEGNQARKILIEDVMYLKVDKPYCQIYVHKRKVPFYIRESLNELLSKKAFKNFLRIHRGIAINKPFIETYLFLDHKVILKGGASLPIGKTYHKTTFHSINLIK